MRVAVHMALQHKSLDQPRCGEGGACSDELQRFAQCTVPELL